MPSSFAVLNPDSVKKIKASLAKAKGGGIDLTEAANIETLHAELTGAVSRNKYMVLDNAAIDAAAQQLSLQANLPPKPKTAMVRK